MRDDETTRAALTAWLAGRYPTDVAVTDLTTPETTGFSGETLLFEVARAAGGHRERLVARLAPSRFQVFPDARFADEVRVLRVLDKHTDIPVPPIRWYEPDAGPLGAPFVVMDRVDGDVPTDMPPYHMDGWVTEIEPVVRERMWWSTLDILARVHRLDPRGYGFLDRPEHGPTGLAQRLGYYAHYLEWGYSGPGKQEVAAEALRWLQAHRPVERHPPALLWGDARIGNVVFSAEGSPRAVLDWETATLGQPEEDLAWFCYLDRHHSEGVAVDRLAGFPSPAETHERYARLLGRELHDLAYYEVLSGFKFAVIMARIGQAYITFGTIPPDDSFPYDNTATRLLARVLQEVS